MVHLDTVGPRPQSDRRAPQRLPQGPRAGQFPHQERGRPEGQEHRRGRDRRDAHVHHYPGPREREPGSAEGCDLEDICGRSLRRGGQEGRDRRLRSFGSFRRHLRQGQGLPNPYRHFHRSHFQGTQLLLPLRLR